MISIAFELKNGIIFLKNRENNLVIQSKTQEDDLNIFIDDSSFQKKINHESGVCYDIDALYENSIFNILFKFENGILNSIKFQLFDRKNQNFDPYDYKVNLEYLYHIIQYSDYLDLNEDEFERGRIYENSWGNIIVFYEIKSLNCGFTVKFKS